MVYFRKKITVFEDIFNIMWTVCVTFEDVLFDKKCIKKVNKVQRVSCYGCKLQLYSLCGVYGISVKVCWYVRCFPIF